MEEKHNYPRLCIFFGCTLCILRSKFFMITPNSLHIFKRSIQKIWLRDDTKQPILKRKGAPKYGLE